jgi:WhiB family transcriptional regulator, redox-sensing transcriptional regulator
MVRNLKTARSEAEGEISMIDEEHLEDGGAARPTRLRQNSNQGDWSLPWLDQAACADRDINDFFVAAGHAISEDTLNCCRQCPVRSECLEHAYDMNISGGYFGGMSPGQRRSLTLERAKQFIATDTPQPVRNLPSRRG